MTSRVRSRAAAAAACLSLLGAGLVAAGPASATPVAGPAITIAPATLGPTIEPTVYGASFPSAAFATAANLGWARWGGSATSRYNYAPVTPVTNLGDAFYFENTSAALPPMQSWIGDQAGRSISVTVPMTGWVAKDASSCGFSTDYYAVTQDSYDTITPRPACGNGLVSGQPLAVTEAPTITSQAFGTTEQKSMATFAKNNAGAKGVVGPVVYHLDNEPSLWSTTHRDIVPTLPSSSAFFATTAATAAAVKQGDSTGLVAGPGEWGWCAWFYFPNDSPGACSPGTESGAAGIPYGQMYLRQMRAAEVAQSTTLLDVFDEHFYPQGTGVYTSDPTADGSDQTKALRLRSVRGLWDPTYTDESPIAASNYPQPQLIRRMRQWVDAEYPSGSPKPKLGISEYAFGAIDTMNGALAQADALGVLGREGVSYAALWAPPTSATSQGTFAFRMFRNLDGAGLQTFGNQSVQATSQDQDQVSAYAANRSSDGALTIVLINKTGSDVTSPLDIQGDGFAATGSRYVYSAADQTQIVSSTLQVGDLGSNPAITLPASSITTLVLPRTGVTSSLSLAPASKTITYPGTAALTATLTQGGSPLAGTTVRFQARAKGTSTWSTIGDVVTGTTGVATKVVSPSRHTEYRVIDLRAGLTATPAPPSTVTTLYSRRSATLSTSRTSVALGGSFVLSGKAAPNASGRTASLQRKSSTGSWSTIKSRTVSSTSSYSFSVSATKRGTFSYRVVVSADTSHYAATSPTRSVKVT